MSSRTSLFTVEERQQILNSVQPMTDEEATKIKLAEERNCDTEYHLPVGTDCSSSTNSEQKLDLTKFRRLQRTNTSRDRNFVLFTEKERDNFLSSITPMTAEKAKKLKALDEESDYSLVDHTFSFPICPDIMLDPADFKYELTESDFDEPVQP